MNYFARFEHQYLDMYRKPWDVIRTVRFFFLAWNTLLIQSEGQNTLPIVMYLYRGGYRAG
jgi:hypothetical protein